MSIALIVARTGGIAVAEWRQLVVQDSDLRIRNEPYMAVNPKTQQRLTIPAGEADSELKVEDQWIPFCRFDNARLICKFTSHLEDPHDPVRRKIVTVAQQLDATITTDAGDENLNWS